MNGTMVKKTLLFLLVISLVVGCFNGCVPENTLPLPSEPKEEQVETVQLENDDLNFSVLVPANWKESKSERQITYTEPITGTGISIRIENYHPSINTVTGNSIASSVNQSGISLLNFSKGTGDRFTYTLCYTDSNNVTVDEFWWYFWTYQYVYSISYTVEQKYEEKFRSYYSEAVNSFEITDTDYLITENYAGYFNENTLAYIEYPYVWSYDEFSTGFSVTSPDTGTVITIDNVNSIDGFEEITELQYQEIMRSSVQNIALSNFQNNGEQIVAELFYTQNSIKYYVCNFMINRGNFIFNITFVANSTYVEKDYPVFETMLNSVQWWGGEQLSE